ncbi:endonuclease/exonuclease/phosphatase family protein [Flavobacterium aquatile]|uniref:Endonuclease n=1 Tax=Flavobacterium aquatile LMG 4008 = ATCC 11947 TaxID=1453498 RepID=A0A095SUN8_9FLAO|nr:endonuclease/exonuclease/phosphatase family protein [Flavobacterium aquatile]KGD68322.1 endonuclease [Flavobacterium aquatile LMG 4008 = ATCC 11947]OXA68745.1 endonuclease [Flavobacterium aquatile] [Flavobacterium aquatile LMG 4008 = ATCC 11947]
MKKLSVFNKVMYFFNIVLTVLTFIAYVLPFLAPKFFPFLSVLTLVLPLFLIVNGLFFIFWMLQLKRQMILSGIVLVLGITFVNKFYKFSTNDQAFEEKDFVVMSYNVRLFNLFQWIERESVKDEMKAFIDEQNPDILCIQEYSETANVDLRVYKHKFIFMQGNKIKTGQAIFSKFPIIDQGNIEFPESDNLIVYADIRKGSDTIRVYNMHLQSIKISPDVSEMQEHVETIDQQKSQMVFKRIGEAFTKQQLQAEILMKHKKECNYPMIICGDMNNSAFSYVYRSIKGNLNDCFEEAGKGFGETYNFKYYPARIDYIFADKSMKVKSFQNFPLFKNSDHYPIVTRLMIEK